MKDNLDYHIGYAMIQSYKKSVYMNKIFRLIKEKDNLDYLEESDDDEEFENISPTKFLTANTTKDRLGKFVSYITMFESKVAISTISTMLGENLALGNKVFACNLTKMDIMDFPNGGICSIKNCDF